MTSVVTCEFSDTNTHWLMFGTQPCTIVLGSVRNLGCCRYRLVPARAMHSLWIVKIGSAKVGKGGEAATGLCVCCECGQGGYVQQDCTTSGAKSLLK